MQVQDKQKEHPSGCFVKVLHSQISGTKLSCVLHFRDKFQMDTPQPKASEAGKQ